MLRAGTTDIGLGSGQSSWGLWTPQSAGSRRARGSAVRLQEFATRRSAEYPSADSPTTWSICRAVEHHAAGARHLGTLSALAFQAVNPREVMAGPLSRVRYTSNRTSKPSTEISMMLECLEKYQRICDR